MLYCLVKWSRRIRILLGGYKSYEEQHWLFNLTGKMPIEEIRRRLIPLCYQYNAFSSTYLGQVWTCRKLDKDNIHQYHLRFYHNHKSTIVTGHWELDPLLFPLEHLKGVDLKCLTISEIQSLKLALTRKDDYDDRG